MEAVITNGARRAGSNALRHVVAAMGFEDVGGGIIDGKLCLGPPGPGRTQRPAYAIETVLQPGQMIGAHSPHLVTRHFQIRILREPKNMAVSWYRWKHDPTSVLDFRRWIDGEKMFYDSTVPYFEAWLGGPSLVWFEALWEAPTMFRIGSWLDIEVDVEMWDSIVSNAWGQPGTWSGEHSDWHDWFDGKALANFGARWSQAGARL